MNSKDSTRVMVGFPIMQWAVAPVIEEIKSATGYTLEVLDVHVPPLPSDAPTGSPEPTFDEHGYPTETALDAIRTWQGTPAGLVDFVTALYRNGGVAVRDDVDSWDRPVKHITFVTGGWSGCESVDGALSSTLFNMFAWQSSHRGGLTEFEVKADMWESEGFWGDVRRMPKAETAE